jgi:SRSO17 transposase
MEYQSRREEAEYSKLMTRLACVSAREAGFNNMKRYVRGLISKVERKNGWQLAEALGDKTPYAIQQFLYRGGFNSDTARDVVRSYIVDEIGEEDGVLVPDETGIMKQGKKSCGVKRQYSGTAGRIANCQIGVFLNYASHKGHALIDRQLFMPEDWMKDKKRRKEAGVPENLKFMTKPQMALDMIKRATEAKVPYRWVTGDSLYGDCKYIQQWLEDNQKYYVLCLSGKAYIAENGKSVQVREIIASLPAEGWVTESCGEGSKGHRLYDWLSWEINEPTPEGFTRWMLIRRSLSDSKDIRAYICFAPKETSNQKLVEIAGIRWTVETSFKEAKSEVGLDQYEVRSHDGWYRHITLACIAMALLTVLSSKSMDMESIQRHHPNSSSLDDFKKGRNLHV